MRKIEILVVEDDPVWGASLKAMYESLLDDSEEDMTRVVRHEPHGRDAHNFLKAVEPESLHLLSLDINLGLTHQKREDGSPDVGTVGACGLDLLKLAATQHSCRAVIVITGAAQDEAVRTVTRNEGELAIIEMSLEEYVSSFFPGRYKLLRKVPTQRRSVNEQVQHFRSILSTKELLFLSRPHNEFLRECSGVWRLTFAGKSARLQERDCLAGLKLLQHLLSYPNQEFTSLTLQQFNTPGEQRETTEGKKERAIALDAGLVPGRTGFERLLDERGPSQEELNNLLDIRLRKMREWLNEWSELCEAGQDEQSADALQNSEKAYNDAMALATLLQRADAVTELRQVTKENSFRDYWQPLVEWAPQLSKDTGDAKSGEEAKGRFQRTLAQQAQDSIARSVKQALKKIKNVHPELYEHLRFQKGVNIGTKRCVYSPQHKTEWFVVNDV